MGMLPLVFHIHRFALDDGPGIRTTIFLKGCPLACCWCHNPESIRGEAEVAIYPDSCIHCSACSAVCPVAAVSGSPALQVDRSRCRACGQCAAACPCLAIRTIGKEYRPDELLATIMLDKHYFDASGGGVTFSGGEPTLWMDYLSTALQALKAAGIHTAIQTCGLFSPADFCRQILPFVDLIMFDLKFIAGREQQKFTGQDSAAILENFQRLTIEAQSRLLPRVPLVPGITATRKNLLEIAAFLAGSGYSSCDLLHYNPAGAEKRQAIGMNLPLHPPLARLSLEAEAELRELFLERLGNG